MHGLRFPLKRKGQEFEWLAVGVQRAAPSRALIVLYCSRIWWHQNKWELSSRGLCLVREVQCEDKAVLSTVVRVHPERMGACPRPGVELQGGEAWLGKPSFSGQEGTPKLHPTGWAGVIHRWWRQRCWGRRADSRDAHWHSWTLPSPLIASWAVPRSGSSVWYKSHRIHSDSGDLGSSVYSVTN